MDTINTVNAVKNGTGTEHPMGIVLTQVRHGDKLINDWVLQQLADFKDVLFKVQIRYNTHIKQAALEGKPVALYKPNSPGAEDYEKLTEEFLQLWQKQS